MEGYCGGSQVERKNKNNINIHTVYLPRMSVQYSTVQSHIKFCCLFCILSVVAVMWFFLLIVVFMIYSQSEKAKYHISFTLILSLKFTVIP